MNTMRITFFLHVFGACLVQVLSGTHPDGVSKVSREQDALGNYKFSYAVSNPEGEHFREEGTDDSGRVIGSYGLKHVDGTHRFVGYVADENGFRVQIHSNEPGVGNAESADASISKVHSDPPALAVAATSEDKSASKFGARLTADSSRVSYIDEDKSSLQKQLESEPSEIKQKNIEDYRPRNPTAYYPSGSVDASRPLRPPPRSATRVSPPNSRSQTPSGESRPLDVYLPPINPHNAGRRPPYYASRERSLDPSDYTSTSRRPYTPPYGGFDDDPVPVDRRPGLSMSTIHGGLGRDDYESPLSATPSYGAGRYPSVDSPLSRDFISPHFPSRSNFPPLNLPRLPGGPLSVPPRRVPGTVFRPPSYNAGLNPANFVLRAVPIPNGIQAVRVDPETGRVYERLLYPMYIRDGQPVYDRNAILHNDDDSDDEIIRNHDPNYFDIAFQRRPPFRSIRNPTLDLDEDFRNTSRRFNQSFDPLTLSIPTARDLEWIRRQLSQVEGFDRTHFSNQPVYRNTGFENNEYPLFNDFDDSRDENEERNSRYRNSDYFDDSFAREPRFFDRLTPEDTKEIASKSDSETADVKTSETNPKASVAEKAP